MFWRIRRNLKKIKKNFLPSKENFKPDKLKKLHRLLERTRNGIESVSTKLSRESRYIEENPDLFMKIKGYLHNTRNIIEETQPVVEELIEECGKKLPTVLEDKFIIIKENFEKTRDLIDNANETLNELNEIIRKKEKIIKSRDASGNIYEVRFQKSSLWPTPDTRGYAGEKRRGFVFGNANDALKLLKSWIREQKSIHEGNFMLPEAGNFRAYRTRSLNGTSVGSTHAIVYYRREKNKIYIRFCEYITEGIHNEAVNHENLTGNRYNRIFRENYAEAHKTHQNTYTGWKDIKDLNDL